MVFSWQAKGVPMELDKTLYNQEPEMEELLSDPIVRILMHYDGLSVREFLPIMSQWKSASATRELA